MLGSLISIENSDKIITGDRLGYIESWEKSVVCECNKATISYENCYCD